jgi:N-acetylglucosamine kinase-like BadF-type ATPase
MSLARRRGAVVALGKDSETLCARRSWRHSRAAEPGARLSAAIIRTAATYQAALGTYVVFCGASRLVAFGSAHQSSCDHERLVQSAKWTRLAVCHFDRWNE